ncbi:MAG: hypothetical protein IKX40_11805, partial [Thermoguttaceae bacterium]|nr:hypothetical protein [Thermoguttaceae bacterium]
APLALEGRKRVFIDFVIIEPIPWAEANGYKGCVPPGRVPASQLIYLRKKILRAPKFRINFAPPLDNSLKINKIDVLI